MVETDKGLQVLWEARIGREQRDCEAKLRSWRGGVVLKSGLVVSGAADTAA
jgi:hypothetical protein